MSARLDPQIIQEISRRGGFTLWGVSNVTPLSAFDHYRRWITAGFHGTMHFLEDASGLAKRASPRLFFPAARSILILGARYSGRIPFADPGGLTGLISAHSRGRDYHQVLRERAACVAEELSRAAGRLVEFLVAVDSSPVLEKPLAVRAGLGWQGRNSLAIHPQEGSFFFLTEIFTSLELEPASQEIPDLCGNCRRCLDACPTACILPDRRIDARRCLAYQTIENRGSIPLELRPLLGRRLFGCDACQSVCPWNQKASEVGVLTEFLPRSLEDVFPDLPVLVHLSGAEFKSRFTGTGLIRARRRGLLRNAAVVLGNTGCEDAVESLSYLLFNEADALIRGHAAWGLGQISSCRARDFLSTALSRETDETVLEEIRLSLAEDHGAQAGMAASSATTAVE
ncbi:MAG: tRNA epoxyqueuosine(34) reductase QueG [Leptolinea sp.]|jgi:epoxyqueuosine reductase|nr:tRNA epoxyqueuosine(34) reductase QueG [Leptolinea sp.]